MTVKPITGSWFEFQQHSRVEGELYNPALAAFTEAQWRTQLREMREAGMEYIPLLATALDDRAYFPTDIYPPTEELSCADPIEMLMDEADKLGMKLFISTGYYGNWMETERNMTEPERLDRMLRAMEQLAELYGSHPSFYGWYYPDECWLREHIPEQFARYVNLASAQAHRLDSRYRTLIAPYGTKDIVADDRYIRELEKLDVDFVAYQDEVGVRKSSTEDTPRYYEALHRAHEKAGRSAIWADVEVFVHQGQTYKSPLIPATFERVKRQLEAVSPYVDRILIYQYQGMMNKPGSAAFAGPPESVRLYQDYMAWVSAKRLRP